MAFLEKVGKFLLQFSESYWQ